MLKGEKMKKRYKTVVVPNSIRTLLIGSSNIVNNVSYANYYIRHRNGKNRLINVPNAILKLIQKTILQYILYPYYSEFCHPNCRGFRRGYGTLDSAQPHVGKKYVMSLDIKDFFSSIKTKTVEASLNKIELVNSPLLVKQIASLCTYRDCLPQGASTSPFLSNIIMYEVDQKITEITETYSYTRYADDIIISGNKHPGYLISKIKEILRHEGLLLNNKKTKIMLPHQRQNVLGITVNEKSSIPRKLRRNIRMQLYNLANSEFQMPEELQGMLRYIKSINLVQYNNLMDYYKKIKNKTEMRKTKLDYESYI